MRPGVIGVLALLLGTAGCGSSSSSVVPATLDGTRVARMVEAQLESEHASLSAGRMTCPDLAARVGARARCTRMATLSRGRWVRLLGTVAVVSIEDGGRLHVQLDDQAVEYGLTAAYVSRLVADRVRRRSGSRPAAVRCPAVEGPVGRSATCAITLRGREHHVQKATVTVTARDPDSYSTRIRLDVGRTLSGADALPAR